MIIAIIITGIIFRAGHTTTTRCKCVPRWDLLGLTTPLLELAPISNYIGLGGTRRDWAMASRDLCEKKRQPLVASRQSMVVRYPEALSPYQASPAKIALANNFQSDGEEDRAGQRHHHRHHHRRCLGRCLFVFISLLLLSMIIIVTVVAITITTKSQAVPTFRRPASFKVMERWRVGGQTRSGHVSELFP